MSLFKELVERRVPQIIGSYLFASSRGENPIGEYVFRKTVYRTYEAFKEFIF